MNRTSSLEWWRPASAESASLPRIGRRAGGSLSFWALMGFTFVLLIAPQSIFPSLEIFRLALLTSLIATVAYVWDRILHPKTAPHPAAIWVAVALAAWSAVTIPLSYDPIDSATFLLNNYSKALI